MREGRLVESRPGACRLERLVAEVEDEEGPLRLSGDALPVEHEERSSLAGRFDGNPEDLQGFVVADIVWVKQARLCLSVEACPLLDEGANPQGAAAGIDDLHAEVLRHSSRDLRPLLP